jgi:Flp pilus assembly pilin Flp
MSASEGKTMLRKLFYDENGFIISAELVIVASILVVGLIVGMSEIQHAVVAELNDVADAIGSANQSYMFSGFSKWDGSGFWSCGGQLHAFTAGSAFVDVFDECDLNQCMLACNPPLVEGPKCDYGYIPNCAMVVPGPSAVPMTAPTPTVPQAAPENAEATAPVPMP